MFEFLPIQTGAISLEAYAELFRTCFPNAHHLNATYLAWLYADNPDGEVVGFDAYHQGRLAAHYACIPVRLNIFGKDCSGLLSLNTATHPDYQGKGLFTQLATRTYERGADLGHHAVYGIANANSTPGFIKKLGFSLIGPLEARIGVGPTAFIDWDRAVRAAQFRRFWDIERVAWRCRNPANPATVTSLSGKGIEVTAKTDKPMISAWANIYGQFDGIGTTRYKFGPGKIFLGLLPEDTYRFRFSMGVPQKFRPSPLNFIYRPLGQDTEIPDRSKIICSFVDFDAF